MVEGPGATRNCRKVEQWALKRKIQSIECAANPKVASSNEQEAWWVGRSLSQVVCIGKEVFLVFSASDICPPQMDEEIAIRLHFGMTGSLEVSNAFTANSSSSISRRNSHKGIPSLRLYFAEPDSSRSGTTNDVTRTAMVINAYHTTVAGPMNANIPRTKLTKLSSCDVCSEEFNHHHVLHKVRKSMFGDRMISDALLDQNVLPGSGNIIKIEGLHDARIHPKQMVSSLCDDQLRLVILSCRSVAIKWLKNGSAPQKSVYNQMICGTCKGAEICMQRVGNSKRTTFWCSKCQRLQEKIFEKNSTSRQQESNSQTNQKAVKNDQQPTMSKIQALRKVCPCHGPDTVVLRRARKGANASRVFHSCRVKSCDFFAWADTSFPLCDCRKRSVILVSKTEQTGGKFFFSCRNQNKNERCRYFAWAQQKDLEKLGDRITPLL